jgi:hypothetical protein
MIYLIISALILLGIAGWIIINILKKNEKLEQMILDQQIYIDQFSQAIEYSDIKLKELDAKNTFKGDDEIGWFFKNILYIQELLNDFKLNVYNEKTTKITQNDPTYNQSFRFGEKPTSPIKPKIY